MGGSREHGGVGEIAEEDACGQFDVFSVLIVSEGVGGFLELGGSVIVGLGTVPDILAVAGSPVDVDFSVLSGVEGVLAVLEEGEFIVGHAPAVLVVRGS